MATEFLSDGLPVDLSQDALVAVRAKVQETLHDLRTRTSTLIPFNAADPEAGVGVLLLKDRLSQLGLRVRHLSGSLLVSRNI